jgi:GDPmannose 4,6-dehydratase
MLLEEGYDVHGTSRDAQMSAFSNLSSFRIKDSIQLHSMALIDFRNVIQTIAKSNPMESTILRARARLVFRLNNRWKHWKALASGPSICWK